MIEFSKFIFEKSNFEKSDFEKCKIKNNNKTEKQTNHNDQMTEKTEGEFQVCSFPLEN